MNISRKFIVGIVLIFAVILYFQMQAPKRFLWKPTFHSADRHPFGSFVFDSIMRQTLPHGYTVSDSTLYQLDKAGYSGNLLITYPEYPQANNYGRHIRNIVKRGGKVVLAVMSYYYFDDGNDSTMTKVLGIGPEDASNFNIKYLQNRLKDNFGEAYTKIYWQGNAGGYPKREYSVYKDLVNVKLSWMEGTDFKQPAYEETTEDGEVRKIPVVASRRIGKGEYIVVSAPLLFTNYGVLDPSTTGFVHRVMSQISDRPVMRLQETSADGGITAEYSPLAYFLLQPPLRSALYMGILALLLFMLFTARRRQRAIPVVSPPQNKSLEFVKYIGTLYHRKHNHTDLVQKKFTYFAEELRRSMMIDVSDPTEDGRTFAALARKTGMEQSELKQTITTLRSVAGSPCKITAKEMHRHIDSINKILKEI